MPDLAGNNDKNAENWFINTVMYAVVSKFKTQQCKQLSLRSVLIIHNSETHVSYTNLCQHFCWPVFLALTSLCRITACIILTKTKRQCLSYFDGTISHVNTQQQNSSNVVLPKNQIFYYMIIG